MVNVDGSVTAGAMPLLLCRSEGGPYEDEAFESGWRLGDLAATLAQPGISALAESIRPAERHQADLIAMAYGYGHVDRAQRRCGLVVGDLYPRPLTSCGVTVGVVWTR